MGPSALGIWGDWLKEWDVMKSLDKVVKNIGEGAPDDFLLASVLTWVAD